jgi:ribonuclease HII
MCSEEISTMTWIVGVDEAGYGPNLGPFVMTAVACRLDDHLAEADLWQLLRPAIRRHKEADDGRPLVEDSKLVYSGPHGMRHLETGVLTLLKAKGQSQSGGRMSLEQHSGSLRPPLCDWPLADLLADLCPSALADLGQECWYTGATSVPIEAKAEDFVSAADRLARASAEAGISWGRIQSVVVCPERFNAVVQRWGSKGVVLGEALVELLRACHDPDNDTDPVTFLVDKHGGRNTYTAMLQEAAPDGMVLVEEEGPRRSSYRVIGLRRPVRLCFTPRADASHLCVALASMVSKYLRELFMIEFNKFWTVHVPNLKPTAGYPGDAARFFASIRPAAVRLGVAEARLWRCK